MGQCKEFVNISTIYECGSFCRKWNTAPVPRFFLKKFFLVQDSTFYDSGNIGERLFKWVIKSRGYLVYETGWGSLGDDITEMNNGSTYGSLRLGVENNGIVNFINSLPNTIIKKDDPIQITLMVKDCDGIQSTIESNKFNFNKK